MMGCTYEIFKLTTNKYVDECEAMFNKHFEGEMYWAGSQFNITGKLEIERDENGGGIISFDSEPFFKRGCMEDDVLYFFKLFCAKHQDIIAEMSYYTEFSVDASSNDLLYKYENGKITGRHIYGCGDSFYPYCEECDYGADDEEDCEPLFTVDDFESGREYICPRCGAVLDTSDWGMETEEFDIIKFAKGLNDA